MTNSTNSTNGVEHMCEAFERLIECHAYSSHPFHNPVCSDAQIALRELRGLLPSLEVASDTSHATKQQFTDEQIEKAAMVWSYRNAHDCGLDWSVNWAVDGASYIEDVRFIVAALTGNNYD